MQREGAMTDTDTCCLGIESSCDETAVALVTRAGRVRVNAVASQVDLHARFGGVVPEVAARMHIQACLPLVEEAMAEAGIGWDGIERIAVTRGPGLIGCLLVGLETAKTLAWLHAKPLAPVNHLAGHLHAIHLAPAGAANRLAEAGEEFEVLPVQPDIDHPLTRSDNPSRIEQPRYPYVGLIVSGGHTSLVEVGAPGVLRRIASTRDDAAGEAYDKVARVAGLGYPGGPVIDRLAADGDGSRVGLTAPMLRRDKPDFSFSGLKTAAGREVERLRTEGGGAIDDATMRDLCAGFQDAVVEALMVKSLNALADSGGRDLVIAGGVACNRGLRRRAAQETARRAGVRIWFPHPSLCTDNAAMIAGLGWHVEPLGKAAALALNADASLAF
jgi:N6-L-threonylcarbamoyladenine synthase